MSKRKLEIDFETADRITLITLKEQRGYLKKELKRFEKGEWLHPEDVVNNTRMIQSLDHVIKYYGG
jgi:aspartyl/asparaginyl beta-hydroxylase (cupin superfamily)